MFDFGSLVRGAGVSLLAATALTVSVGVAPASAAALCSAAGVHPDGLDVSDVKFGVPGDTLSDADGCYGRFDTADSSPATELGVLNGVWDVGGTDPFIFLNKQNIDGVNEAGDLLSGVRFTLGGFSQGTDVDGFDFWEFTLSWTPETSLVVDLVFLIKGANGDDSTAMYLFESIDLMGETSGAGSVVVKLLTPGPNGGPNAGAGQPAGLSHLSLFGRLSDDDIPGGGGEIPLPATVWLFGAGLVGLGVIRRRRRG